jgi:hypothetical protein
MAAEGNGTQVNPWPISPLTDKDLDFAIVNYGFTDLAGQDLGTLPRLEAELDQGLADILTSISDQAVLIASMDGIFDDAASIFNEIAGDDFNQTLGDLDTAATTGDSLLNDYTTLTTPSNPNPPPPPPGTSTCTGPTTTYSAQVAVVFTDTNSPLTLCLSAKVGS